MKLTNLGNATDINVAGNPDTGDVVLHFKNATEAVGLSLSSELAGDLLLSLVHCMAASPKSETKKLVQMLSIRNIAAQTPHPSLPTLVYELELGLQMQTTFDLDDARTLRDQLSRAIESAESQPNPKRH